MPSENLENLKFVCYKLCTDLENGQSYDDSLCCVLEDLILDGLKCDRDKVWQLLQAVSHHAQIDFLRAMENLSSHAGFARAWVRVMLNCGAIGNALKLLSADDGMSDYYTEEAFLMDTERVSAALDVLSSLDKHELNYVCNTVVLNHWRNEGFTATCDPYVTATTEEEKAGFNRRYSVGNKLSVSGDDDEDEDEVETSGEEPAPPSTAMAPSLVPSQEPTTLSSLPSISVGGGLPSSPISEFSENPLVRHGSLSSTAWFSSTSDLSQLPEENVFLSPATDTEERLAFFSEIPSERGLSQQDFKCLSCSTLIGAQGQDFKVCAYDKRYYCRPCFGNYSLSIPCRIIYNWDHNKYRVSKRNFEFLNQVLSQPNLDMSKLNISLYSHVPELAKIRDYRRMLNMTREYLVRCTNKDEVSFESIRKKLGTHGYYWDSPHLYSTSDLQKVYSGQLLNYLKKLVQRAIHHVYCCKRCSSFGFICEYCQNSKPIFAFELATTDQCTGCSAVYHRACKRSQSCPKCVRRRKLMEQRANTATLRES